MAIFFRRVHAVADYPRVDLLRSPRPRANPSDYPCGFARSRRVFVGPGRRRRIFRQSRAGQKYRAHHGMGDLVGRHGVCLCAARGPVGLGESARRRVCMGRSEFMRGCIAARRSHADCVIPRRWRMAGRRALFRIRVGGTDLGPVRPSRVCRVGHAGLLRDHVDRHAALWPAHLARSRRSVRADFRAAGPLCASGSPHGRRPRGVESSALRSRTARRCSRSILH